MLTGTSGIFCFINSVKQKLKARFFSALQWQVFSHSHRYSGWPIWLGSVELHWPAPFHEMGWLDLDGGCRLSLRLIYVFLSLLFHWTHKACFSYCEFQEYRRKANHASGQGPKQVTWHNPRRWRRDVHLPKGVRDGNEDLVNTHQIHDSWIPSIHDLVRPMQSKSPRNKWTSLQASSQPNP